jgi:hypothetical protein
MLARYLLSGLCVVPIVWILAIFPLTPWPLAAAVALYAAALWRWPVAFLLVLPAVLPALDLGFWTGWTVIKSADLFVLATISVLMVRVPLSWSDLLPAGWPRAVLLLLIGSYAIGTVVGLASPLGYTGRSDNVYLRPDNALRLLKGLVEALALLPFMRQRHRTHADTPLWLGRGIAAGLAAVAVEVGIERALFVGLMNFTTDYRVVGPFTSMRIGGGHIGAYVAMALPFVLTLGLGRRRWLAWPLTILIGLGGAHSLAVTFARTAYAAALGASGIVSLGMLLAARRRGRASLALVLLPLAAVLAVIGAAASSSMMQQRFGTLAQDLLTREGNWKAGWSVRDSGLATDLFGMGLGTYQRAMLLRAPVDRPSDLRLEPDGQGSFVSLHSLTPLYFGQKIPVPSPGPLRLTLRFRGDSPSAAIAFALCDKVLLYSDNCRGGQISPSRPGEWESVSAVVDGKGLGDVAIAEIVRKPVEFALYVPALGNTVAFDDVSLRDAAGNELLANGDFEHGLDRWLFTDDDHLSWRIKNQYIMQLFELGALGLVSLLALCGLALAGGLRATLRGNPMGAIVAGSIGSFMISGVSDYVLEVPRIVALFTMICWAGMLLWEDKRPGQSVPCATGTANTQDRRGSGNRRATG